MHENKDHQKILEILFEKYKILIKSLWNINTRKYNRVSNLAGKTGKLEKCLFSKNFLEKLEINEAGKTGKVFSGSTFFSSM